MLDLLRASITDIRRFIQTAALFLFKVFASLITCRAGCTFDTTKNDLVTSVGLLTMIAMDTEVLSIIRGAFMIPVRQSVGLNLF